MISNNLVEHNGSLRYVFGRSSNQLRIEGQWVPENSVNNPSGKSGLLFNLLRALPNWPLVDGINMNKSSGGFVPDAHQFLPMDMLESGWLAGFGVRGGQGGSTTVTSRDSGHAVRGNDVQGQVLIAR